MKNDQDKVVKNDQDKVTKNTQVKTRKVNPEITGNFSVRWDGKDKVDARFTTKTEYENYVKGNHNSHKSVIVVDDDSETQVSKGAW